MVTLNPQRYQVNNQTPRLFHYIFFADLAVKMRAEVRDEKLISPESGEA